MDEALLIFTAVDENGDGELSELELSSKLCDFGFSDAQVSHITIYVYWLLWRVLRNAIQPQSLVLSLGWKALTCRVSLVPPGGMHLHIPPS